MCYVIEWIKSAKISWNWNVFLEEPHTAHRGNTLLWVRPSVNKQTNKAHTAVKLSPEMMTREVMVPVPVRIAQIAPASKAPHSSLRLLITGNRFRNGRNFSYRSKVRRITFRWSSFHRCDHGQCHQQPNLRGFDDCKRAKRNRINLTYREFHLAGTLCVRRRLHWTANVLYSGPTGDSSHEYKQIKLNKSAAFVIEADLTRSQRELGKSRTALVRPCASWKTHQTQG